MAEKSSQKQEIQLHEIKDGKYYVKVKNLDIPIALNEYLYNKWTNQNRDIDFASKL